MNRFLILALCAGSALGASAAQTVLQNFETPAPGTAFTMKNVKGGAADASAQVAVDKTDAANKVLSVSSRSWDTLVELELPDGVTGRNFSALYQTLEFDLYRLESSDDDYMQFAIMLGDDILYWDEGYPHAGDEEKWQHRSYPLGSADNDATHLYIGFNNDKADYCLDNIVLSGLPAEATGTATWTGAVSDLWETDGAANFADGSGAPVAFAAGNNAIFTDDAANFNIKVSGNVQAYDVVFRNNANAYSLAPAAEKAAVAGRGRMVLENGADVALTVENLLEGGTYIKNGRLRAGSAAAVGTSVAIDEGALDFCVNNTSSAYTVVAAPIALSGNPVDIYTSRYTYWTSTLTGSGDINLHCGGERSYLGHQKEKTDADWSAYRGTVTLCPYKEVCGNAGFYGLVFQGNRSFNPGEPDGSRANATLKNCTLVVADGTAIASEGNDRGVRIGELRLEEGGRIYGYYKESKTARSYFMIGNTGTDATLAGRMCPPEKNGKITDGQELGLIKEGKGTYTITGNNNMLTGGIRILDGRVLVCNDAAQAARDKLSGATGSYAKGLTQVFAYEGSVIGGTGNIGGNVDVFGTLQPGADGTGTLAIANYATEEPVDLIVRPAATIEIELASATDHDAVSVSGTLNFYNKTQSFEDSDEKPVVKLTVAPGAQYSEGDEFTLITARRKDSLDGGPWSFALDSDTEGFRLEEREDARGYALVLVAGKSSGIADAAVATDAAAAFVLDGMLHITAAEGERIDICLPDGKTAKTVRAREGLNIIPLDGIAGPFLVGGKSLKLIK